ncbi:MAG TPA: carboxymuconolactone decarboxylase family protein [Saprospiraceae bacterium]|jgi:AhpD family alkylhydroperoxidase|nr:carboxymuconolactone decarboxylase family protein [Saprospiraceae bacterium]HRO07889.1 carboxymuconolactone decarboxylase family protein [Saprospiraceae bacterium]HRP41286.1 carboxymuconolactone decarboxylase family protein [Saprospiraceae bacterium]
MNQHRINYSKDFPDAIKGLMEIEKYVHNSGLDTKIFELVKYRASQINGCAYCMDMHTKDARAAGETEQRLYLVSAWREVDFYTEKEKSALAWTETLTLVAQVHDTDAIYEDLKKNFSDNEIVALTMTIVAINGWNRLSVGFKTPAGSYQPGKW